MPRVARCWLGRFWFVDFGHAGLKASRMAQLPESRPLAQSKVMNPSSASRHREACFRDWEGRGEDRRYGRSCDWPQVGSNGHRMLNTWHGPTSAARSHRPRPPSPAAFRSVPATQASAPQVESTSHLPYTMRDFACWQGNAPSSFAM